MSRQRWMNTAGRPRPDWRVAFSHTPLKGRTTDPEALDWDEASEIFLSGVRCARRGDLEAGRAQIATAFLLDGRSINYCTVLPAPEAADLALDDELLRMLILSDPNSFASTVLNILAARCYGHADKHGQAVIGIAMRSIEFLIKACEQNPTLEKTPNEGGPLGGCLSRPNLLFLRSALHMPMGNHKLAIRDLTAALKINPNYTPARDARASLYATLKLKDNITIHGEYQRIIREVHEDQRGNEVSYAWLAITTLEEPRLGTLDDAKRYYEKSIRATARRDELYGPRRSDELPPCLEVMKQKMAMMGSAPAMERLRRDFDRAAQVGNDEEIHIPDGFVAMENSGPDKRLRHVCLSCGKSAIDKGLTTLLKCGRCKQVHYCSKECQTKDWKDHKLFCKAISLKVTMPVSHPPKMTNQLDSVAKTPVSELTGHARACVRMQDELRKLFPVHGQMFADWWHDKTTQQKIDTLLDVSNDTIPHKRLSDTYIRRDTRNSRCLQEYNLEDLIGTCGCSTEASCSEHIYTDRVLHEIFIRVLRPEMAESFDNAICQTLITKGVLPALSQSLAFVLPQGDGPEKYDMEIVQITDIAPQAEIQECKNRIQAGLLREANQAIYVLQRQMYSLGLLVKLFDTYQEEVRRCTAKNPYERLSGCVACHQTCEGGEATRCGVCRITWWCCQGCKSTTEHGGKCPYGTACDAKCLFN